MQSGIVVYYNMHEYPVLDILSERIGRSRVNLREIDFSHINPTGLTGLARSFPIKIWMS